MHSLSLFQSEKALRHQSSLIVLETRNDGVRFTTSHLRSLSHDHLSLKDQYNSAQSKVSEEVLSIAGKSLSFMTRLC